MARWTFLAGRASFSLPNARVPRGRHVEHALAHTLRLHLTSPTLCAGCFSSPHTHCLLLSSHTRQPREPGVQYLSYRQAGNQTSPRQQSPAKAGKCLDCAALRIYPYPRQRHRGSDNLPVQRTLAYIASPLTTHSSACSTLAARVTDRAHRPRHLHRPPSAPGRPSRDPLLQLHYTRLIPTTATHHAATRDAFGDNILSGLRAVAPEHHIHTHHQGHSIGQLPRLRFRRLWLVQWR